MQPVAVLRFLVAVFSAASEIVAIIAVLTVAIVLGWAVRVALARAPSRMALGRLRKAVGVELAIGAVGFAVPLVAPASRVSVVGFSQAELGFLLLGTAAVLVVSVLVVRLARPEANSGPAGTLLDLNRSRGKRL